LRVRWLAQVMGEISVRGPAPASPDYPAFRVLAELLAGNDSSASYRHVREEMGASYGITYSLWESPEVSVLSVGGELVPAHAMDAMAEILASIRTLREIGPTEDALETATRTAIARQRAAMATDEGLARELADGLAAGVAPATTLDVAARFRGIGRADVQAVAGRYFAEEALRVVLVGAPRDLEGARELGLGEVANVDAFGQ
jgi:predicted Zn-dependent peptidase